VIGPLAIKVIYPTENQLIQSKDSNFIFGSVGNGDAALLINGVSAPVWPNGAFMAWLANPPASSPKYELIAAVGRDTVRYVRPVKIAPQPAPAPVATDTMGGRDTTRVGRDTARVAPDTARKTAVELAPVYATLIGPSTAPSDTDRVVTGYAPTGGIERWFLFPGTVVKVTSLTKDTGYVELDSTRTIAIERKDLRLPPMPGDTAKPAAVAPLAPQPGAPAPKTPAPVTTPPPVTTAPPVMTPPPTVSLPVVTAPPGARRAGDVRITPAAEWTDFAIPVSEKPAHLLEEDTTGIPTAVTLTLYGTTGVSRPATPVTATNSYVASYTVQQAGPSLRYTFTLKGPVYGYQPLWENGAFLLRIRRPPTIDPVDPLRGLTIAVDAGHPPAGATGPTGLREPEITLPVAKRVQALLLARGVNVLMTRMTDSAVDLNLRPAMARRANAQALVSIHLNAVPDGVNPFVAQGTATYYFHPHSRVLADGTQRALVAELGLTDNGIHRQNLALVRPSWMPAILTEGAFIIMPELEAALRTDDYQQRYARAVVAGLESYFKSLAAITR
jgi:N-acetylmuramoyl-L-alanine amidase